MSMLLSNCFILVNHEYNVNFEATTQRFNLFKNKYQKRSTVFCCSRFNKTQQQKNDCAVETMRSIRFRLCGEILKLIRHFFHRIIHKRCYPFTIIKEGRCERSRNSRRNQLAEHFFINNRVQ